MDWKVIDAAIQNKSLLRHDFYQAWSQGDLTLDDLKFYACQYYSLENTIPCLISRTHSLLWDKPEVRKPLLENLVDEELGEPNHRGLWLNFGEGLGLTRADMMQAPLHPLTRACIDSLLQLVATDPVEGLSALYAYESQLPEISKAKIAGLKQHYGIEEPETLRFFEVHKELDVWHAEQEKTMLESLGATESKVLASAEASCDALWGFLDGVDQSTRQMRV